MPETTVQEPQGISFFNVKSGDTHYCKLEPTIAAYINSSDMGINASRGQDFGWKLAPEWVKRVRDFRKDRRSMQMLTQEHGGQKPTTVQILFYIYSEELRAYEEEMDENESPFEDQYQRDIAEKPSRQAVASPVDDVPEDVDEEDLLPPEDEEIDEDAAAEAATSEPASERVEEVPAGDGSKKPTKPATQKQK